MRLLILMSDTGGGHRSAAEAIAAALDRQGTQATVELLDFFATCTPFPLNRAGNIYGPWVNYAAKLWEASFHLTNNRRRAAVLGSIVTFLAHRCVEAKLQAFQPDVLACVHPLATRLAATVRRRHRDTLPFVTVVTDLVTAHASWFSLDVDLLAVPSEAVRQRAISAGIPPEKIALTGQPVHPRFTDIDADPTTIRENLGLLADQYTVLLLGGGEGMGRVAEMANAIDKSGLSVQQIIVCGRNESLRQRLSARTWHVPTHVLGFTRDMPALMHSADVIVTKAGPSTICEALVVGRPLLLTGHVPGQEAGNVRYVLDGDAGWSTPTPQALADALRQLTAVGNESHKRLAANAEQLARPEAAHEIGRLLISLAGNRGAR